MLSFVPALLLSSSINPDGVLSPAKNDALTPQMKCIDAEGKPAWCSDAGAKPAEEEAINDQMKCVDRTFWNEPSWFMR